MAQSLSSASPGRISAGPFLEWLMQARESLRGNVGANVPCGDCIGCCVSSYFIPVRPEDKKARASIPATLLVTVAGQPPGHSMMSYLPDGSCPMLSAGQCSIYPHRPQTCRDYDCRIFAAAGIDAGSTDKVVINRRVREWQFSYPTAADREAHEAVLSASVFIRTRSQSFPGGRAPQAPTGIAVLAIKVYVVFLDPAIQQRSGTDIANAIMTASREFDTGSAA